jgi:crotonobetainyl-CoA:carnitine CoA-transferase CaiB-like acyl-CoA transferase
VGKSEWIEDPGFDSFAGPINDVGEALDAPFVRDHGRIVDVDHPSRGAVRMLASPVRCSDADSRYRAAPKPGRDADDILREAGNRDRRIEGLRKAKVI